MCDVLRPRKFPSGVETVWAFLLFPVNKVPATSRKVDPVDMGVRKVMPDAWPQLCRQDLGAGQRQRAWSVQMKFRILSEKASEASESRTIVKLRQPPGLSMMKFWLGAHERTETLHLDWQQELGIKRRIKASNSYYYPGNSAKLSLSPTENCANLVYKVE